MDVAACCRASEPMSASDLPPHEEERVAVRRAARETRDRAAAAREQSRQIAADREALMQALVAGWAEQTSLLGELRTSREVLQVAARAFAAALRRENVPPERMLIEVKELVRTSKPARGPEGRELVDQVVSWSIEGYYGAGL